MSLQVWLPLNGDLNNQGLHKYPITIFRGTETYNNQGKIGKCFYSNGVNTIKILDIIPDFQTYISYSLCAWFYIETNNTTHSGSAIISAGDWNSQVLNLSLSDWSTDHYTRLRVSGTNWKNWYNYNFNTNTWYHVVVCSDGNKTYAYVNGNLIGDTIAGFLPSSISGHDLCIGGATYYGGMQFFGKINDARVYNHCLSSKEVEEISKGLVLHYQLNDTINIKDTVNLLGSGKSEKFVNVWGSYGFSSTGVLSIANINPAISGETVLVTNNGDNGKAGEIATSFGNSIMNKGDSITVSAYVKGNGATIGKTGTIHMYNTNGTNTQSTGKQFTFTDKWQRVFYTLTWTYDNPSNASGNMYIYCPRNNGESFYVSNCQAERGTAPTAFTTDSRISNKIIYDVSGYNNNGVAVGNLTIDPISSKFNYSTKFNGNGNLIKTTPFYFDTKDWTVSFWYYHPLAISSTWNSFICLSKDTGTDPNKKFALMFNNGNSNHLWCKVNSGSGRTFPIKTNVWTHLTLTSDGKVYENGILKISSLSPGDNITGAYDLVIGSRAASANINTTFSEYTGNISDVRVYATALTEAQVKELYRISMNIDGTNILPRDLE